MAGYSASPIDLTLEDEALSERMANMVLESPQSSQVFQHHAGVIPLDQPHTPPDPYRSPFVVNNLLPLPFMNGAYPPPFLQQQQSEQSHVPANPIINPNLLPPQPTSQALYSQQKPVEPAPHQVVDLTSRSPSLEPQVRSLPPQLPPKTSVCIGQLSAAALILYPVNYLNPDGEQSVGSEKEWAPVRLSYKHGLSGASGGGTINIGTPTSRGTLGEQLGGEDFGVVEQKVVNVVGPMLGKGMVRLEAKIRKGLPNVSFDKRLFNFCC